MERQYSLFDAVEKNTQNEVNEPAEILAFKPGAAGSFAKTLETMATTQEGREAIIDMACQLVDDKLAIRKVRITSPADSGRYFKARMGDLDHEVFAVLFLDNQHNVLGFEVLFRGTIDGASVYPREVVKEALRYNAAAVVLGHNHPSGNSEPSSADLHLTKRLKDALAMVDIRTLDHLIVGRGIPYSLAENSQM
jgi:DNA repair protein RadC